MAKKSQVIWLGFAHVKNMGAGPLVANGDGAQLFIAVRADSAEEFESRAIAIFRQNRFQVMGIEHIENEFNVPKDETNPLAAEKIELFKRLTQGHRFALGKFYAYGEKQIEPTTPEE